MYPLAIRAVATRIGPWLGNLVRSSPTFLVRFTDKLKKGGKFVGSTASDVAKWVGENPANAALAVATAASLGVSVADLIDDSAPDAADLMESLNGVVSQARLSPADAGRAAKRLLESGALSESLDLGMAADDSDDELAIAVLGYAKQQFGSVAGAKAAHRYMQAFFEMPARDVKSGMGKLDLSPQRVAEAMATLDRAAM